MSHARIAQKRESYSPRARNLATALPRPQRVNSKIGNPMLSPEVIDEFNKIRKEGGEEELLNATVEGFEFVARAWGLTSHEAAGLLGVCPSEWKSKAWHKMLSRERIMRVVACVAMHRALHMYFSDALADEWVRCKNTYPLFGGQTPIQTMVAGGLSAIKGALDYVDGLRG